VEPETDDGKAGNECWGVVATAASVGIFLSSIAALVACVDERLSHKPQQLPSFLLVPADHITNEP
jgi:hypothetical protein